MKIEKGIPIPERSNNTGEFSDIRLMDIGDSFTAFESKRKAILAVAIRAEFKMVVRGIGNNNIRVWRVE